MRSPGCGTSRTPRSSQRTLSPTTTSSVAKSTALPAAPAGSRLDRRQLAGARPQVRGEHAHAVRRLDRLERRRRARVDLDRPRALAVPDEVDAEQPAQRERGGQARADRARLPQQVARARPRAGAAGRRSRTSGSRARRTRGRPTSCSVSAEHDRVRAVADRRRRARRRPSMRSCTTVAGRQRAAAPRAHAACRRRRAAACAASGPSDRRAPRRSVRGYARPASRSAAPSRCGSRTARSVCGVLPSSACRSASRATSAGWFSKLAP